MMEVPGYLRRDIYLTSRAVDSEFKGLVDVYPNLGLSLWRASAKGGFPTVSRTGGRLYAVGAAWMLHQRKGDAKFVREMNKPFQNKEKSKK